MRIGLSEIIVLAVIVVALYDPTKLKGFAIKLNKTIKDIASALSQVQEDVVRPVQEDVVQPIKDQVDSVTKPLSDAKESITEMFNGGNVK